MLKLMRSHKFFTVFLLSAITIMITVAFVFWGIGPQDNPEIQIVASINDHTITLNEFWRAYDNQYEEMKKQYPDPEEIKKLKFEERVLDSLVDRTVLMIAARKAGVKVTGNELQNAIISIPVFQKDGVFDNNVYQRFLKFRRMSPRTFENSLRTDMIITKMSQLIGETADLTPDEYKMINSLKGENKEQLVRIFISTKRNQNIQAYIESMKRHLKITINRDLIS